MFQLRSIASLLALAILLANVCCLYHRPPQQAVKSAHACCKASHVPQQEQQTPARSCECCERVVAKVDTAAKHLHSAPDFSLAIAILSIEHDCGLLAPAATNRPFDAHAPPMPAADILQQSCALIL
jgi:hypothetical protein